MLMKVVAPTTVAAAALLVTPLVTASPDHPEDLDSAAGAVPMQPRDFQPDTDLRGESLPQYLGDKILFVNFDGAQMNSCNNNDPQDNCSTIFGGTVLPFSGDDNKRASIVQVIRKKVEPYGLTITNERPGSGDYDMEMVGDWQNVNDPGFAGVAPSIDCFDARGGEVSFTLDISGTSDGTAEIVLQELAHTWGLEHIDDTSDLLFPTTQGQGKVFTNQCLKIVGNTDLDPSNGFCNQMHTMFCMSGWQNSHEEMLALFGQSIPDTGAPQVVILNPADGSTQQGGDVELQVGIADNERPAIINLQIMLSSPSLPEPVESQGAFASPNELAFPIEGLPDGTYTLVVSGEDESDNPAMDEISFTIEGSEVPGGDGGGGTGGGDGDGGSDAGDGDGGADGGDGGDGGTKSRGCTVARRSIPMGWALFALLPLVARRRRI